MKHEAGSHEIICRGFSLPSDKATSLKLELQNLVEESPCDSNVTVLIEKTKEIYHAIISIRSTSGAFSTSHDSSQLEEAITESFRHIYWELNAWKDSRFPMERKQAA